MFLKACIIAVSQRKDVYMNVFVVAVYCSTEYKLEAYSTNLFQTGCVCTRLCNVDCRYVYIVSLHYI